MSETDGAMTPFAVRIAKGLVLAWMTLGLLSTGYGVTRQFVLPAVRELPQRPSLPWMFVFLPLGMLLFNLTLGAITYRHLRRQPGRGWWWCGALCVFQCVATLPAILTFTLVRVPPNNLPMYTQAPWNLVRALLGAALYLVFLVVLYRTPVMQAFHLEAVNKGKNMLRMSGMGLLLFLASIVVSWLASAPAVLLQP